MADMKTNPVLSGKAEAWTNPELIADIVSPLLPVASEHFSVDVFPIGSFIQTYDNEVGRLDSPKTIDLQANQKEYKTTDYALDAVLPRYDTERQDQQVKGLNSKVNLKQAFTLALAASQANSRELRVATMYQDLSSFIAGNRITLAGPSQWSDPTSRPLDDITRAINNSMVPYNLMVMGPAAFFALQIHPQIVGAILKSGGSVGLTSQPEMESLFGIKIIVGKGFATVNITQDFDRANERIRRTWGSHCSLLYVNPQAAAIAGLGQYTFGYTARVGGTRIGEIFDPMKGARGSDILRILDVGKSLITASFCGFLFRDCAAATPILSLSNLY